jgi:Shikimate 5-dehydrogenase
LDRIRLGLVGDNIAASRAPDLHHAAAQICGINVAYERLVPRELGLTFDMLIGQAKEQGLRGLNITHPYKERILQFVTIEDSTVKAIGACNTVLFNMHPIGLNTDYTGYIEAFKERFGDALPGAVAIAGSGGVGKAIGFALAQLGAKSLKLFDTDERKSFALANSLRKAQHRMNVFVAPSLEDACADADGLINCTPLGMTGYEGNTFNGVRLKGRRWICDAVYTPVETAFLKEAKAAGVEILSGFELFLYQGIHAFQLFTGRQVNAVTLRRMLAPPP